MEPEFYYKGDLIKPSLVNYNNKITEFPNIKWSIVYSDNKYLINKIQLNRLILKRTVLETVDQLNCQGMFDKCKVSCVLIDKKYIIKYDDKTLNEIKMYKLFSKNIQNYITPNIVLLYGILFCNNNKYMILEKGDETFASFLKNNDQITMEQLIQNIGQIFITYYQIVLLGYTHNDLKPQNIVVNHDDNYYSNYYEINGKWIIIENYGYSIKLIDFGLTGPVKKVNFLKDLQRFCVLTAAEITNIK